MAICFYKITSRYAAINPLLMQGRCLATAYAKIAKEPDPMIIQSQLIKSGKIACSLPLNSKNLIQINRQDFNSTKLVENSIVHCKSVNQSSNEPSESGGPDDEQLSLVYEKLRENLPQLFVNTLDYSIYNPKIIFENRIIGKTCHGLYPYVKQMSLLRFWGHVKFMYVKLDILKMTKHPEDGTVKIRWRISGISGYKLAIKMVQFRVWQPRKMIEEQQSSWIDGFSTMYVGSDGLIHKHVADKVMPDEDKQTITIEKVIAGAKSLPKLAVFVKLSADLTPSII